jgi:hypothetical protein
MATRLTEHDLALTLTKKGYSIQSSFGKGIKSTLGSQVDGKGKTADVEQHTGPEPLGKKRVALRYSGPVLVRFQFFRRRLADPDGNSGKYYLDALRYAGALEDDSERHIRLVTEPQQKVETNEEERVEITLEYESVDLNNLWKEV